MAENKTAQLIRRLEDGLQTVINGLLTVQTVVTEMEDENRPPAPVLTLIRGGKRDELSSKDTASIPSIERMSADET